MYVATRATNSEHDTTNGHNMSEMYKKAVGTIQEWNRVIGSVKMPVLLLPVIVRVKGQSCTHAILIALDKVKREQTYYDSANQ